MCDVITHIDLIFKTPQVGLITQIILLVNS